MDTLKDEQLTVRSPEDVVKVRQSVRSISIAAGFGLVDQTKLVTAASELARNTLDYGGGGTVRLQWLRNGVRSGVRMIFEDNGPGIPDLELAMKDGYTTGGGLGLGLSGSKRLVNDFEIHSKVGEGTRIAATRWK
jgi:serine/threonine-protein kinase RsbT